MASSTLINDAVYPYVVNCFSKKGNIINYEKIIASFVDRNNELLSAIGPMKNILFTDYEKKYMYDLIDIDPTVINKAKSASKDVKQTGMNLKDPYKSLMTVVLRYFSLAKNESIIHMTTFYIGCSLYPSLYYKYFKYDPNPNIMTYTINNLSNKFKLKQSKNLMSTIDDIAYGAYLLHKDEIDKGTDNGIVQFILALQTRLNSFLKKIRGEFAKNYESGNYLNTERESNEKDNYREAESSVYVVSRLVDKISLRLVIDGPPMKLITISARNNSVSVNELRNYINNMVVNEKMDDIKSVIESILMLYLINDKNSSDEINSDKFLMYCLNMYKRSNTTDANIISIKRILDKWLDELGTYKKTQRVATINNFRRALFTFFVMSIQYYNVR